MHGGGRTLFLTSRQQREILIGDSKTAEWSELTLPSRNTDVTALLAVGTLGEGVFVYEGKTTRYVSRAAQLPAGGGGN